jgi:hypothetical protein
MWLKQSAAVTVKMGPFVDSTDGNTQEIALTISQADIRLSKNGGLYAQTNNVAGATHDEKGNYGVPLDTTDTNTLGTLRVHIHETGALAVWQDFMVVPANVWDSLFGADALQVDVAQWLGTAAATPTVAGVPEVDLTHVAGATTNVAALATNVDAILTDTAVIGAAGAGLTAVPWNAAWDAEVQSEADDALVAQRLDELLNADSDIDGLAPPTVGSVFHELLTKTAGSFTYDQATDSLEAIRDTAPLGTAMRGTDSAALATVCTEARLAKTDSLTFTVANVIDANLLRLNGVAASAQNLEKSASVIHQGSVTGAATTTTLIDSGLTEADVDFWKGRIIIFTSGALLGQATDITAFDPVTDKLTFTALTNAPAAAVTYVIV